MKFKELYGKSSERLQDFHKLSKKTGIPSVTLISKYYNHWKHDKIAIDEFIDFRFYDKNGGIDNFLSFMLAKKYWKVLNPDKYALLARNKFISHCWLRDNGVKIPKLYCYYNSEAAECHDILANDIKSVINVLRNQGVVNCVVKPADDSAHGHGVVCAYNLKYSEESGTFETNNGRVRSIEELLGTDPLLFEEHIVQNQQMMSLNPTSVNTVRIMTALYPDHQVKLLGVFMRVGRIGADVDNCGAGGNIDGAIDPITGKCYRALQVQSLDDMREIEIHPDTKARVKDLVIQDWDSIVKIVKGYQGRLPQLKAIGWDVSLTEEGPVIIEINNWWDSVGQAFLGRGWRKEVEDCYNAWVQFYKNRISK